MQQWAARKDETATGKQFGVSLHRAVAEEMGLDLSLGAVMHFPDSDGLNCADENLRIDVNGHMNHADQHKTPGTSRFKGVYWNKGSGKWHSRIRVPHSGPGQGVRFNLGYFTSEIDAAKAYDAKARELFGCYARLNFPAPGERSGLV
jgi:hypothetical protein